MDGKRTSEGGEETVTPNQHCTGDPPCKRGPPLLDLKPSMFSDALVNITMTWRGICPCTWMHRPSNPRRAVQQVRYSHALGTDQKIDVGQSQAIIMNRNVSLTGRTSLHKLKRFLCFRTFFPTLSLPDCEKKLETMCLLFQGAIWRAKIPSIRYTGHHRVIERITCQALPMKLRTLLAAGRISNIFQHRVMRNWYA